MVQLRQREYIDDAAGRVHRGDRVPHGASTRYNAIVREVSGNGAFWMEPWIEVKRPGQFPVVYGPVTADDVAGVIDGSRADLAVGVRGQQAVGDVRPLAEHPFFKDQIQVLTRNAAI